MRDSIPSAAQLRDALLAAVRAGNAADWAAGTDEQAAATELLGGAHGIRLAARLMQFAVDGPPATRPLPHLDVESTPPLANVFASLAQPLQAWLAAGEAQRSALAEPLATAAAAASLRGLLVLWGQRLTPGSVTDRRAVPPPFDTMIAVSQQPHSPADPLTVGARALAKHAARHEASESFWGAVRGNTAEKNARALAVIERILAEWTWWNVFGHFQHDVVYEARVPSGHGARWGNGGTSFIGFLEPFDVERGF